MLNAFRWYSVRLEDIILEGTSRNMQLSLGNEVKRANAGKGVIVDSGTTDTYLPHYLRGRFEQLFKQVSGVAYSTSRMPLNEVQRAALPTVVLRLQSLDGTIDVRVPSSSYIDRLGPGMFVGRIFLTENSGAVLGANVMNGHDVLFDPEAKRVGFAISDCTYTQPPAPIPGAIVSSVENPVVSSVPLHKSGPEDANLSPLYLNFDRGFHPVAPCSARCNLNLGREYRANGTQIWAHSGVVGILRGTLNRTCTVGCSAINTPLPASDPSCISSAWGECNDACSQSRNQAVRDMQGKCHYKNERRPCKVGACSPRKGDTVLSFDIRFGGLVHDLWSYVMRERIQATLATLLSVPDGNVLVAASSISGDGSGTHVILNVRVRFSSAFENDGAPQERGADAFKMVKQHSFKKSIAQVMASDPDVSFWGWIQPLHFRVSKVSLDSIGTMATDSSHTNGSALVVFRLREESSDSRVIDVVVVGMLLAGILIINCIFFLLRRRKNAVGMKERFKI